MDGGGFSFSLVSGVRWVRFFLFENKAARFLWKARQQLLKLELC